MNRRVATIGRRTRYRLTLYRWRADKIRWRLAYYRWQAYEASAGDLSLVGDQDGWRQSLADEPRWLSFERRRRGIMAEKTKLSPTLTRVLIQHRRSTKLSSQYSNTCSQSQKPNIKHVLTAASRQARAQRTKN